MKNSFLSEDSSAKSQRYLSMGNKFHWLEKTEGTAWLESNCNSDRRDPSDINASFTVFHTSDGLFYFVADYVRVRNVGK